ncbi:MAG: hypothetical protein K2G45_08175 [Lachnospiraceae bacterium]|nr:hypothetical protein [Lachnospiraceae bacterium]
MNEVRNASPQINHVENFNVDGSDVSPIANLFISGANGMLQAAVELSAFLGMIIISFLLLVPWRLIALRKNAKIANDELAVSKKLLLAFIAITPITNLIITHFTYLFFIAVLTLIPTVLLSTLSILPMKKRINNNKQN